MFVITRTFMDNSAAIRGMTSCNFDFGKDGASPATCVHMSKIDSNASCDVMFLFCIFLYRAGYKCRENKKT